MQPHDSSKTYHFQKFLPRDVRRLKIRDLLCTSVLYSQLVDNAFRFLATPTELDDLIQLANIFPIDLTCLVQKLVGKLYKAQILDTIVTQHGLDQITVQSAYEGNPPR